MKAHLYSVYADKRNESISGVAFSSPGVVDEKSQQILGISAIPYIHHFNIYEELEALFGLPVTIENDANCAGLAEIYEGAAKGKKKCFLSLLGQELVERFFAMANCTKVLIYMEASLD